MRKYFILFAVLLTLSFTKVSSQQISFQKLYTMGLGTMTLSQSVHQTSDDGYILSGFQNKIPPINIELIKTNSMGVTQWAKKYGVNLLPSPLPPTEDITRIQMPYCTRQTTDGGYIIAGQLSSKCYLLKIDPAGAISWAKTYADNSCGKVVKQTADGYIVTGYKVDNTKTDSTSIYLLKVNTTGGIVWDKVIKISALENDMATGVEEVTDGYVVCGYTTQRLASDTTTDIVLLKTDLAGSLLWSNTYGDDAESEEAYDLKKIPTGFILTGSTTKTSSGADGSDLFILKTDASGVPAFSSAYSVGLSDIGYRICPTATGYAVLGTTFGTISLSLLSNFILKTDAFGSPTFGETFGQQFASNFFADGQQTSDGGFVLSGWGQSISMDVLLIKTQASGLAGCFESPAFTIQRTYTPTPGVFTPTITSPGTSSTINAMVMTQTVNDSILCMPLTVDAGADRTVCQYESTILGGSPTAVGGSSPYTFSWLPTNDLSDASIANPIFIPSTAGTFTYIVTVTDNSSTVDMDTIVITVNPTPTATLDPFGSYCISADPFELTTGTPAGGTYSGTGVTGTTFSPADAGVGTHIISYTFANAFGCADTAMQSIIVYNPDPTITPAGPFCSNAPLVTLQAASPGGVWSGPGITDSVGGVFDAYIAGPGSHIIYYGFPAPCQTMDSVIIIVNPSANATINWPGLLCVFDNSVILTAAETGGIWSGNGIINPATGEFSPDSAGIGIVQVFYQITGQCGDKDSLNLVITGPLNATITPAGPFCSNNMPVNLTAVDSSGVWSGLGIINPVTGSFSPVVSGAGTHTIHYVISGSCGDSDSTTITVNLAPEINAAVKNESCLNAADGSINLTISGGTPAYHYYWNTDSSSQAQNTLPILNLHPGHYFIRVSDSKGCSDTNSYNIVASVTPCFLPHVWVPNIFSPNNDGQNDVLYVRGMGVKELTFYIYDRWGEKVFETTDQAKGWDGTFKNKPMNSAVYVYYLKAILIDDKVIDKKGNITLVR
jgi:gliding motility-associated-like protein